jgi:S1-C subfamily serine protease
MRQSRRASIARPAYNRIEVKYLERIVLWRIAGMLLGLLVVAGGTIGAAAQSRSPSSGADISSAAERVYVSTRPKLVQIRTLLSSTGQQTSLGSGFLVSSSGLAITNYHVVSRYALEPGTFRLEYASVDGMRGGLTILALDLADDLAVVRLEKSDQPFLAFDPRPLAELSKGERLYAMGNPLDIGFAIVEGTYNGLVEHSYTDRIHFSGALNPGMSGGPAVTADGKVVGINVASRVGGELVSFLVPARFAVALFDRAQTHDAPLPQDLRAEIGRQLTAWLGNLYSELDKIELRPAAFGPYSAPRIDAPWMTCWAQTNTGQIPKPRASIDTTNCSSDTRLFVSDDLHTGAITLSQSLVRSVDLNQFQFATLLSRDVQLPWVGPSPRRWYTQQRCQEDFTLAGAASGSLAVDAVWCARAYRQFNGLYDVAVVSVTQDRGSEALVSRLGMQGVTYENAMTLTKRIFAALQWTK